MATVEPGSSRYQALFGSIQDDLFESRLPSHDVFVNALADPSLDPDKIDDNFSINDQIGSIGVLRKQGVADLQLGVKYMLKSVSVPVSGSTGTLGNGMLTQHINALDDIVAPTNLASSLSVAGVGNALGKLEPGMTPAQIAGRAAFGVGMAALSAMGPVGAAASAIVGFAAAIFSAFRAKRRKEARNEEERRQIAYEALPPLMEPRNNDVDDWYLNNVLLGLLETGSWTPIFSPRFDAGAEWVGVERLGGMAFAPGSTMSGENEFGLSNDVFNPTGGVGLVPGLNRITSVVQVSIDWLNSLSFKSWQETFQGPWPVTQAIVQDVGSFYVNTARLASVAWAWVSQQDAGVDLYKVYVGKHNGPGTDHLSYKWKEYCASGLRFIVLNAEDYYKLEGDPPQQSYERVRSGDPQYVLGSAISCAIGAWRCKQDGGTTYKPKYRLTDFPAETFEMGTQHGLGPGRLRSHGCVMDVGSAMAGVDTDRCIITMYDSHIRPALDRVRKRQLHFLRHSLVCAYVRREWDAFKDKEIKERLDKSRATLLEHPDRRLVNLRDVPRDEPGVPGKPGTWREQLIAAGVPRVPTVSGFKFGHKRPAGTLEPEDEPAPVVPGAQHAMPWSDGRPPEIEPVEGHIISPGGANPWPWIAGAGALVGAAGWLLARSQKNGSF